MAADPHVPAEQRSDLPIRGFKGTPAEIERQWFEQVYTGSGDSMKQLTLRAVLMGSALGGILSVTNIYIGLKAGWAFGVAITACILSFAIWNTLYSIGIARTRMTILENNCMQSTASSAGYSTGGTLVSAFAAYIMIQGNTLDPLILMAWVFLLAVLGVTMAIPMKRQMINVEQLRFPEGTAAAETLHALHSHGAHALKAARALFISGAAAMLSALATEGPAVLGHYVKSLEWLETWSIGAAVAWINTGVWGEVWMGRTVMFIWDPIFIAAGAISGLRIGISMLLGGTLCWVVFIPWVQAYHAPGASGFQALVQWSLWGGTACMVTSGLVSFAMQWRSVLRAFRGLGNMFGARRDENDELQNRMDAIETPGWWFVAGQVVAGIGIIFLAKYTFDMAYWESTLAVLLSFALALVACRVTGETSTTPTGAMGKIMQLTFGALAPGKVTTNLMAANITSGAAGSSADLLNDLRSGYLLGANPRMQFLAQFAGIFTGTVATVVCFQVIVPDASVLGGDQFPAPAAQQWRAVALAMGEGLSELHPVKVWALAIGGAVGIILPLLGKFFPKAAPYLPSAAAIGLSWTFHWFYSLLFFTGGLLGFIFERVAPGKAKDYLFPIASGVIAGGALTGVALVFVENGPDIIRQFVERFGG